MGDQAFYVLRNLVKANLGFECGVPGRLTQSVPYTLASGVFMIGPSVLSVSLPIVNIDTFIIVVLADWLELNVPFNGTFANLNMKVNIWRGVSWRHMFDHFHIVVNGVVEGVDVALERVAGIFGRALIHEGLNFSIIVPHFFPYPASNKRLLIC